MTQVGPVSPSLRRKEVGYRERDREKEGLREEEGEEASFWL